MFEFEFEQDEFETRDLMPDFPTVDPKIENKFEKAIRMYCPDFTEEVDNQFRLEPMFGWDDDEESSSDGSYWDHPDDNEYPDHMAEIDNYYEALAEAAVFPGRS